MLELLLRTVGQEEIYWRLSGSLVAEPSALIDLGWTPPLAAAVGLGRLIRTHGS
jgi:hypothetical protein